MKRIVIFGLAGLGLATGLWVFSERVLFAMNWQDMGIDGADIVAGLRTDLNAGRAGLIGTGTPCVKDRVAVDLSFHLTGYLPQGDDVLMRVSVSAAQAMFEQVYLGPPTSVIRADAAPLCLDRPDPLTETDAGAFGYLNISFYDVSGNRFQNFGSEDADPIFSWQDVSVELLEQPQESRSGGITQLHIKPLLK